MYNLLYCREKKKRESRTNRENNPLRRRMGCRRPPCKAVVGVLNAMQGVVVRVLTRTILGG